MWGIGASVGPCIMGQVLTGGQSWNMGYRAISFLQIGLTVLLFVSLPLWRKKAAGAELGAEQGKETKNIAAGDSGAKTAAPLMIPGIPCRGVGQTAFSAGHRAYSGSKGDDGFLLLLQYGGADHQPLAGSYLVLHKGMSAESAAGFAGLFFIGITVGRFFSGFLTMKFSDSQMIRLGQAIILLGVVHCCFLSAIWPHCQDFCCWDLAVRRFIRPSSTPHRSTLAGTILRL